MPGVASGSLGHFAWRGAAPPRRRAVSLPMIALARRYRPKRFADLLVQDHVSAVLRGAVARGRVAHGYLLTGPRGVGKTTAARILAMALNCRRRDPSGEPCTECEDCVRIWSGAASLDVVEIDAASNRGVDDARELRERALYAASGEGRYKVYIVDEAHMLTREAWNALLKILEEPPPRVVFVFATTEPQKIAATAAPVLSRLQRFDFRRIGPAAIRDRLRQVVDREGIAADDDALLLLARHADGGLRDALSMLDQCLSFGEGPLTVERVRAVLGLPSDALYAEVLALVAERRPAAVFPLVDRLIEQGADLVEFMAGAGEMLRALLMLQVGAEPEGLTDAMRGVLERYRSALQPGDLLRMLKLLAETEVAIRRSATGRLAVETLLLRWAMLDRIVDLERVLRGEGAGGEVPAPAGAAEAPRERVPPGPVSSAPAPVAAPVGAADPGAGVPEAPAPAALAAGGAAFSVEGLREAWSAIAARLGERRQLLRAALEDAVPVEVAPPELTVELPESSIFARALEENAALVEEVIGEAVAQPVRLRIAVRSGAEAPRRMSEAMLRAERLKGLRARDPALDTAVDALDLEIVE